MSTIQPDPSDPSKTPLWRIKYRPNSLEAIKKIHPKAYTQLMGFKKAGNFPHLIFVGPRGSGKSTLAEILAHEVLGSEFNLNFSILFADDPIGKDERKETKRQGRISAKKLGSSSGGQRNFRPFIQMRVRPFVSSQKFGNAPFKMLAIKNFHALDVEQQAFRRIMEQYSKNCRMILITDRISGIIDPVLSRCQLLAVPQVKDAFFNRYLKSICDLEGISIKKDSLDYISHVCQKNFGKALDLLQLTVQRFGQVNLDTLSKIQGEVQSGSVKKLFAQTFSGNFKTIRATLRDIFRKQNLSKNEILLELSQIITTLPLEREARAFYLDRIAAVDFESLDSNSDEIQLNKILSEMVYIGKGMK